MSLTINRFNLDHLSQNLQQIKQQSPLILNITNFVAMQTTANALLALGAAPIMAHAVSELDDLTSIANALVINMGTLDNALLESIDCAQRLAKTKKNTNCI